jgi:hypothetical protein
MSRNCILIDTKARKELAYLPRFTVEEGLEALKKSLVTERA